MYVVSVGFSFISREEESVDACKYSCYEDNINSKKKTLLCQKHGNIMVERVASVACLDPVQR